MSSRKIAESARPFISADRHEARLKALRLYRQWYRSVEYIYTKYKGNLPISTTMMKEKLREEYNKNRYITDLRAIDLLIFEGQNDLRDIIALYSQQCHIMGKWWKDTVPPKPNTFMDKFIKGSD